MPERRLQKTREAYSGDCVAEYLNGKQQPDRPTRADALWGVRTTLEQFFRDHPDWPWKPDLHDDSWAV